MSEEHKAKVKAQFGAATESYATSNVHAKGQSLNILLELIKPQPVWRMLDVGTGAGHTALTFAPHVAHVTATDLTDEMLAKTAELAAERGLTNIGTRSADAEALPFDDATFDLVTCRLAMHHFSNPHQALGEFARVLKPGGLLGLVDNVTVPDKQAAGYYNAYEKLRDPSHNWVYPLVRLQVMVEKAGLQVKVTRELTKELEFQQWVNSQPGVTAATKDKLLDMMRNLPEALRPFLAPRWADDTMYFTLHEAVLAARLAQK